MNWMNHNCYNCAFWKAEDYGVSPEGHCTECDEPAEEYDTCELWQHKEDR